MMMVCLSLQSKTRIGLLQKLYCEFLATLVLARLRAYA